MSSSAPMSDGGDANGKIMPMLSSSSSSLNRLSGTKCGVAGAILGAEAGAASVRSSLADSLTENARLRRDLHALAKALRTAEEDAKEKAKQLAAYEKQKGPAEAGGGGVARLLRHHRVMGALVSISMGPHSLGLLEPLQPSLVLGHDLHHEPLQQGGGQFGVPRLASELHGVLVQPVALAQLDALTEPVVALVQQRRNPPELQQFVLLALLRQPDVVEIVECLDAGAWPARRRSQHLGILMRDQNSSRCSLSLAVRSSAWMMMFRPQIWPGGTLFALQAEKQHLCRIAMVREHGVVQHDLLQQFDELVGKVRAMKDLTATEISSGSLVSDRAVCTTCGLVSSFRLTRYLASDLNREFSLHTPDEVFVALAPLIGKAGQIFGQGIVRGRLLRALVHSAARFSSQGSSSLSRFRFSTSATSSLNLGAGRYLEYAQRSGSDVPAAQDSI
uniref:Protein kinase domain-containing protein n=1 Tax=Macrostomum lignano TaxID=282301 RepID=A0A1I8F4W6_9PLAT